MLVLHGQRARRTVHTAVDDSAQLCMNYEWNYQRRHSLANWAVLSKMAYIMGHVQTDSGLHYLTWSSTSFQQLKVFGNQSEFSDGSLVCMLRCCSIFNK